jgi:hypothetical protein
MSQTIIHNNNSNRTTRISEEPTTNGAQAKPTNWISTGRMALASYWRRICRDIDSRCYPVERKLTPPDPSKPTSLSGKLVADIWLLNSKL